MPDWKNDHGHALYLDGEGKVVPASDPSARTPLVGVEGSLPEDVARQHGLLKGKAAKVAEEAQPAEAAPTETPKSDETGAGGPSDGMPRRPLNPEAQTGPGKSGEEKK